MTTNNKLEIGCVRIRPYGPDSRLAHEHPCLVEFDGRHEFLRKGIRHLAVAIILHNTRTNARGEIPAAGSSYRAVLVNGDTGEPVTARTFSARLAKGEEYGAVRVDLPLREDMVHERYIYELQILNYRDNTLLETVALKFREDCRPKVLSAWLTDNTLDHRYSRIRKADKAIAVFAIDHDCDDGPMPEMAIRFRHDDGSSDLAIATRHSYRGDTVFFSRIPVDITDRQDTEIELECLGRKVGSFPLMFADDAPVCGFFDADGTETELAADDDTDEFEARLDAFISDCLKDCDNIESTAAEEDNRETTPEQHAEPSAMDCLDRLVGLDDVKAKVRRLYSTNRFYNLRREAGLAVRRQPLHALFLGSPGTGKTTVAGIMGRLLAEAGVLSRGHVVMRERSTLIGRFYGDEEKATRKAIDEADGGILFIDEAYQLCRQEDPKDPARLVLETMMTALSDPDRRDWMVIMAGYTAPMLKMLDVNPGLRSRIPDSNHYVFDDYLPEQLEAIADKYLAENQYLISDDARHLLRNVLNDSYRNRDASFGNARFVMNLLETGVLPAMAERVVGMANPDSSTLQTILPADIPAPALIVPRHADRRPLGFAV